MVEPLWEKWVRAQWTLDSCHTNPSPSTHSQSSSEYPLIYYCRNLFFIYTPVEGTVINIRPISLKFFEELDFGSLTCSHGRVKCCSCNEFVYVVAPYQTEVSLNLLLCEYTGSCHIQCWKQCYWVTALPHGLLLSAVTCHVCDTRCGSSM